MLERIKHILERIDVLDREAQYMENLILQFSQTIGINQTDFNSGNFDEEFNFWLLERQRISEQYKQLLDDKNIDYINPNTAEISKGKHDSIVLSNGITKMITNYITEIPRDENNRIIKSDFQIIRSKPKIRNPKNNPNFNRLNHFMIQNPYGKDQITNWDKLHNYGQYQITLGLYGKITDKDIESKIKMLKSIKNKLKDNYQEEFETKQGNYFYILSTNQPKKKIKTK